MREDWEEVELKDICVIVVTFEPDNKVSERLKRQCDYQFDYSKLQNA